MMKEVGKETSKMIYIIEDGKSQREEKLRMGTTTRSGNAGTQGAPTVVRKTTHKTKKNNGGVRKKQNLNQDDYGYDNNNNL